MFTPHIFWTVINKGVNGVQNVFVMLKATQVHRFDSQEMHELMTKYTILPKILGRPLLMNRFDYFSNFHEYKS